MLELKSTLESEAAVRDCMRTFGSGCKTIEADARSNNSIGSAT